VITRWKKKGVAPAIKAAKRSGEKRPERGGADLVETKPIRGEGLRTEVLASFQSDAGCVRTVNEDRSLYVRPDKSGGGEGKGALFIVADGMGGHSAGEVASEMAVNIVNRAYYESAEDSQTALENAVSEANRSIYEASLRDERLQGMGTTCTALALQDGSAVSAHVGDSRIYLVRDGEIYLMTEDHSQVMEMVKMGLISLKEARHHPDKNIILRALGSHAEVEVATWQEPFPIRGGDRFILCSDGLYDLVEDEEIKRAATDCDPPSACEALIALAKERGGFDNITVGVVALERPGGGKTKGVRQTREAEVLK
jgi:serine/threonine protein phosphatase PrpC